MHLLNENFRLEETFFTVGNKSPIAAWCGAEAEIFWEA